MNQRPESFLFPGEAAADANRAAQIALWKSGVLELRPFVSLLDTAFRTAGVAPFDDAPAAALDAPHCRTTTRSRLRGEYDVLLAGPCDSPLHAQFVSRVARRLVGEGLSVLYVGLSDADLHQAGAALSSIAKQGVLDILDLRDHCDRSDAREVHQEARRIWGQLGEICAAKRLHLPGEEFAEVVEAVYARRLWRRVQDSLAIRRSVLTRVWWRPLCAELAWWASETSVRCSSFQHSIVTCPASFSPLPLDVLFCFGAPSAQLIKSLNDSFYAAVGEPARALACVPAGAMYDNIMRSPSGRRDILVLDELAGQWTKDVFGCELSQSGLVHVVAELASRLASGTKLVVRCHPHAETSTIWRELQEAFPDTLTFSAPGRSLDDDMQGCGMCLGLYSTVIPVAAASGLATFVLYEQGWYYTPDLASLGSCLISRDEAIELIHRCSQDDAILLERQGASRIAGHAYFHNGSSWDLDNPPIYPLAIAE